MKFAQTSAFFLAMVYAGLGGAVFAACGSGDAATASATPDGAAPIDGSTASGGDGGDGGVTADGSSDASDASDARVVDAGSTMAAQVLLRPLSPTGADRFFGVTYDAQNRIVAVGQVCPEGTGGDCESAIARFLPDGSPDLAFGAAGVVKRNLAAGTSGETARGVLVTADGKIVIAAIGEEQGAADARERDVYLARFLSTGAIDTSFGTNGVAVFNLAPGKLVGTAYKTDAQVGLAADATGRLYVSGSALAIGRNDSDFAVLRCSADGVRDASFGTGGLFTLDISNADASARTLAISPSGQVVAAGYMTESGGAIVPVVYRLSAGGLLDTSFGVGGVFTQAVLAAQTEAYDVAFQGDRLVTNGYGRGTTSEEFDYISLRITGSGALDTTFGTSGFVRVDRNGFKDQGRAVVVLADKRVLLVGSGRATANDADGMLVLLTENGTPDTALGARGQRLFDLGGTNDTLSAAAKSSDGLRAVAVGTRAFLPAAADAGVDAGTVKDDDGALVIVNLR